MSALSPWANYQEAIVLHDFLGPFSVWFMFSHGIRINKQQLSDFNLGSYAIILQFPEFQELTTSGSKAKIGATLTHRPVKYKTFTMKPNNMAQTLFSVHEEKKRTSKRDSTSIRKLKQFKMSPLSIYMKNHPKSLTVGKLMQQEIY